MNEQIVGRAELKLAEAAKAFRYDFRDKVVLDIGSSTGGFTEYVLRNGACEVIAIEKGTNQMKVPLRFDPRIKLYEKTDFLEIGDCNVRNHSVEDRCLEIMSELSKIDTVVADVSFVSLRKILLQAQKCVAQKADYLVMLKPQFEARAEQLNRGMIKNEKMRREIVREFEQWLGKNSFIILNKRDNETTGKVKGNRERFYWLKVGRKPIRGNGQ